MTYFAFFQGYIVTANADGSIPLNSKIALEGVKPENNGLLETLLQQANAYAKQQEGSRS